MKVFCRCGACLTLAALTCSSRSLLGRALEVSSAAEEAAPEPQHQATEQIVVTGSAIRRRDLLTSAPLTTLERADIDALGLSSLGQILQTLPEQGNAQNDQLNIGSDGSTRISLRSLGAQRTLVLLNGRRFVFGGLGADSSVDLNAIPAAIVERIEVLKEGNSAIYGSDAISGVVNIITKRRYQGTEVSAYAGSSSRGDAPRYEVDVTSGIATARGGVLFSAGYYNQDALFSSARDWARFPLRYDFATGKASASGSSAVPEGRITLPCSSTASGNSCDGPGTAALQDLLHMYPGVTTFFRDRTSGMWRPFNGAGLSDDPRGPGDFYNYAPENYLVTPQQRYNVFSSGDLQLGGSVRGYFEALYLDRQSTQRMATEALFTDNPPPPNDPIVVSAKSIYNPFGVDLDSVRRRIIEGPPRTSEEDVATFRAVVGVDGLFSSSQRLWTYDLHFNFGRTTGTLTTDGYMVISRLRNALGPSYRDANGVPHCGTPDNTVPGCVPLDLFSGPGTITADMLRYVSYAGVAHGSDEQKIVSARVTGPLFDFPWGGHVSLAIGAELDREDGDHRPDPISASNDNSDMGDLAIAGGFTVITAFAELDAILLDKAIGFDRLELSAAVRAGSYDTFGAFATYHGGLRWQIVPEVALRGTLSTAFRAPNVVDLYGGVTTSLVMDLTDPCDSSTARPQDTDAQCTKENVPSSFRDDGSPKRVRSGGNPNLQPETAVTFTGGVVLAPTLSNGITLTIDYFSVDITNAIGELGSSLILNNCYRTSVHGNCDRVHRDPTSKAIVLVDDTNLNVGGQRAAGVDFDISWHMAARPLGSLRLSAAGTWLTKFEATEAGGLVVNGLGNADLGAMPRIKLNFGARWARGSLGAAATVRVTGAWRECENDDCAAVDARRRAIATYATIGLQVSKRFVWSVGATELSLGVLNVLNTEPPPVYGATAEGTVSDPAGYDYLGRYVYVRMRQTF